MRKTLAIILALVLTLAAVPMAMAETDYASKEKYTFDWTTYFTALPAEDCITIKLMEDKYNVDINMLPIEDSNFLEVLNTYIMGGDTPDVIRLKDPGQFSSYVQQGVLGEINMDILREHAPSLCKALDEYEGGSFWSYGAVDGKQYGIPAISGGNVFHLPIVYNKTWMEAVGVTKTPETIEEFEDLMRKFTFEDPDGNGVNDTYGLSSDGLRALFGAYGVNPGACDGRTDHSYFQLIGGEVEYAATTTQYQEALKVAARWYKEGLIDPEFITGENTGGYWAISHSLINHRIGMTVRGNYYHWITPDMYMDIAPDGSDVPPTPGNVAKEWIAANPDEAITFGPPPVGPYGAGVKSWNMLAQFYCFSPEVCANEDMFARICDIMEFWTRRFPNSSVEEIQAYYEDVYGEEGHYWIWKDKESHWADLLYEVYEADYPPFAAVDAFGPNQWGPTIPGPQVGRGPEYAYGLGYDKNGIINLVQFSLPSMALYQTDLTNRKDNWMINFINGTKDVEADWEAYIDEMNASGLEIMLEEVRDWYASATAK